MNIQVGAQRLKPPKEYVEHLRKLGGNNPYGEPNFILFWGQTRTIRTGYGDMLQGFGMACWFLAEWHPAEDYGSPNEWDYQVLGPFPHRGEYEVIMRFSRKNEKGEIEPMPLNFQTFDFMIPVINKHKNDSIEKRERYLRDLKQADDDKLTSHIADTIEGAHPAFNKAESISFAGQRNTNPYIKQKMELIERNMGKIPRLNKGIQQVSA